MSTLQEITRKVILDNSDPTLKVYAETFGWCKWNSFDYNEKLNEILPSNVKIISAHIYTDEHDRKEHYVKLRKVLLLVGGFASYTPLVIQSHEVKYHLPIGCKCFENPPDSTDCFAWKDPNLTITRKDSRKRNTTLIRLVSINYLDWYVIPYHVIHFLQVL